MEKVVKSSLAIRAGTWVNQIHALENEYHLKTLFLSIALALFIYFK